MKENLLIDKSIAFVARIVKLHQHLIKNKKEAVICVYVGILSYIPCASFIIKCSCSHNIWPVPHFTQSF
ncbi:MAG: hypothetical protein IKJ69_05380 [Clostridia bacterium]|nr:hypothetical protein [Clostridia bacterium]